MFEKLVRIECRNGTMYLWNDFVSIDYKLEYPKSKIKKIVFNIIFKLLNIKFKKPYDTNINWDNKLQHILDDSYPKTLAFGDEKLKLKSRQSYFETTYIPKVTNELYK